MSIFGNVFGGDGLTGAQVAARMWPGAAAGQFIALGAYPTTNASVAAADLIYLYWFPWPETKTIDALFARVSTGGTGSAVKFGLWRAAAGRPTGLPIASNNTGGATTGTGSVTLAVTTMSLAASGYWFGSVHTGSPLPAFTSLAGTFAGSAIVPRSSANAAIGSSGGSQNIGVSAPFAYAGDIAALDLTSATFTDVVGGIPLGGVRFA